MSQPPWEWGAPHYRGGHDQRPEMAPRPLCPGCRADVGAQTALVEHHKAHAAELLEECSALVGAGAEGFSAGWSCRLRALLRSPLVHDFLREPESLAERDTALQ
jgi:hypothetical protein